MSILPICSGTRRSMVNCAKGFSVATSVLVLVRPIRPLLDWWARRLLSPIPHFAPHPHDGAVHVHHARADTEEEEPDHPPRPRPEPAITRPADGAADDHGDHQLHADAQAEPERRTASTRPVGSVTARRLRPTSSRFLEPLLQSPQRVLRVAFAHR